MTKLILVEGLPGSGKSTFSARISGFYAEQGRNTNLYSEGELLPDMKDLPFYEVVVEKQVDGAFLVTENMKHFPAKPFIVTAKEFLDILNTAE